MPKTENSAETRKNKFWNFSARNEQTSTPAELVLYGDISSYSSWRDDEITPKQFDAELKALGDVDEITVRINSGGGDVFAAAAIYARLKDHKAKINVKIDGWAASAATVIAMAGDVIQIPASGVFMIHNPQMGLVGYYGVEDFAKLSEELAVIKQSIVNAYCLKTGKSEAEVSALMDKETWLEGKQAVESGFCTELMFGDVQTEVENESHVVVNSVFMDLSEYANVPKSLLNRPNSGDFTNKTAEQTPKQGGIDEMEIKTADQLRAAYPELTEEIENAAKAAERKRINEIESVSLKGFEKITNAAKFDNPISSGEVAMQIIAEQKKQGASTLENIEADVKDSGVADVTSDMRETSGAEDSSAENPYMTALDKLVAERKEN